MLAYGDGVSNVDIAKLVEFHRAHGKLATITAVQPIGRFGSLDIEDDEVVGGVVAPGVEPSRRSRPVMALGERRVLRARAGGARPDRR